VAVVSALPRSICSVCGRSVPVRRNGDTREHLDPSTGEKCAGAGLPPRASIVNGFTVPRPTPPRPLGFESGWWRVHVQLRFAWEAS
jgi:hypothetical protein